MPCHVFLEDSLEADTPRVRLQGFKPSLEKTYYAGGFLTCNTDYVANIQGDSPLEEGDDLYKPKAKAECTWVQDPGDCTHWVDIVYGGLKRYPLDKDAAYSTEQETMKVFSLSMPNLIAEGDLWKYRNYWMDEIKALINILSEYGINTEAIPLDMNVTARERKLSLLTQDHPNLLSWALNTAVKKNLIHGGEVGTDILPLAVVFRNINDEQELRSDDIVPVLDFLGGSSAVTEIAPCRPTFSTVNIL